MENSLQIVGIAAAFGFVIIAGVAAGLHFFVALNSPPSQRALWTVAPAYLVFSMFGTLGDGQAFPSWVWPVGGILPAAIWYAFWLRDFQKRWYANVESLPDGIPLANHDWKNGLLHLFALLVFGTIFGFLRHTFGS